MCDGVIEHGSWRRCSKSIASAGVQGRVDPLLHDDEDQLGLIVWKGLEALEDLRDLVKLHSLQLTI